MREYRQYIGGEWIGSAELFDDLDPYRGTVMARIPAGTRADAARAVDAAAAAFPAWAELPPAEKQTLFLRAADIVERRRTDIVDLLAAETSCAAGFAGFQVLTATRLLRQAANWGYLPVGEVIRSDVPGTFAMALRRPLGVVAGISPWNGAHVLAWRTVVNPLAFGNTVVLKPSEESPVSAGLLIPEIMEEAGFPAGAINVVTHAPGEAVPIADEFFERPEVRCINFTGSSATGRMLAERWGLPVEMAVIAGRHHDACEGIELDLLRIVHVACRLADVLGFDVVKPLAPSSADAVLAELPPGARLRLTQAPEELLKRIEERIREFGGETTEIQPEHALAMLASAATEHEPEASVSPEPVASPEAGVSKDPSTNQAVAPDPEPVESEKRPNWSRAIVLGVVMGLAAAAALAYWMLR